MDVKRVLVGILALTLHYTKKLLFGRKVVITILVGLFVAAVMAYAGSQSHAPLEDGTNMMDTLILFFFMPVMAMIFGSSLIRDEIDDKSITHIATAPLDRAFTYVGYYLPLGIAVAVSMVSISSVGMLAFFGQHGVGSEAFEIYLEFVALVVIGSFVYSSLFLAIGVLFPKPVMVGLFYAFIWEGFIGSLPGAIQNASIKHYLRSVGCGWVDFGSISRWDQASSVSGSAAVLLCLALFFLVSGVYLFREKELA
ncbi:MAG: ABC transporter permease [Candidatus Thermoplasmatota archaeon]|nr:ABC transporter permease [Candidatus Thermoplasmatota archaeon]